MLLTGYFFWFAGDNLRVEFTHDDLMNTYRAWLASWKSLWLDNVVFFRPTPVYRPLPEMAYKLSFLAFGFDLLPFRILLTGLLLANAFLVYLFGASISHSKLAGLIAAAVMVYHPNLMALYYDTGLCFDIFCFFFYFVSLIVYLRLRSRPTAPLALAFLLSYVCALNSKEMAVSLPVAMFFIELLFFRLGGDYRRATLISWPFRQGKWVSIAALMALLFILGRVLSANGLVNAGDTGSIYRSMNT